MLSEHSLTSVSVQDCQRPLTEVGQPMVIAGLQQMGSLVAAMAAEWEMAAHNATLAALAQAQKQQLDAEQPVAPEAAEAAAAAVGGGAAAVGAAEEAIVEDLVEGIAEKPEAMDVS